VGHLKDEIVEAGVDHLGFENAGDAQGLHPLVAGPGDLDQRQLALDEIADLGQVADPAHRDQAFQLGADLVQHLRRPRGDDGDPRQVAFHVDLGDGEAFDVVAASGEQADDPGQHARLVVHQHREDALFDFRRLA
jgi:hypothetical protein